MKQITPKILNKYFYFWALFLPISSVLLIPSIQGTIPGYLFAFISIFLVLFVYKMQIHKLLILKDLTIFLYVFTLINLISQLCNIFFDIPDISYLRLVEPENPFQIVFRTSFFTQSLYLVPGVLTFVFVKRYYNSTWDHYLYIGITLFVLYGLYEFFYFLIFRDFGDFLSNRNFDQHKTIVLGNQLMTIGSFTFQRINSLSPEPSMFAFTVLPFWVYAIHTNRKWVSRLLLLGLLLSASSTAMICIAFYYIFYGILKANKLKLFFLMCLGTIVVLLFGDIIYTMIDKIFLQKINLNTASGIERSQYFKTHMEYFSELNPLSMLFGLGFGYVRSTDYFSTLLINNGIVGLLLFTGLFLYPIFKLKNNYRNIGIKFSLIITYISMMISVPEFSYLSIWLFLGMAYRKLHLEPL
jgi:hypothetical protein